MKDTPIASKNLGYAFAYSFFPGADSYILQGAFSTFDALHELKFSGRCECYSAENFLMGGRHFTIGIMLRFADKKIKPDYAWWKKFSEIVSAKSEKYKESITLDLLSSELAEKSAIERSLLPSGTAEFSEGEVKHIFESPYGSFF